MPIRWHPNGKPWRNCRRISKSSVAAAKHRYSERASCKRPATATLAGLQSSRRRTGGTGLCKLHLQRMHQPTCKQAPGRARFIRSQAASNLTRLCTSSARHPAPPSKPSLEEPVRAGCSASSCAARIIWRRDGAQKNGSLAGRPAAGAGDPQSEPEIGPGQHGKGVCRRDLPTETPPLRCGCQRRDWVETDFRVVAPSVVAGLSTAVAHARRNAEAGMEVLTCRPLAARASRT